MRRIKRTDYGLLWNDERAKAPEPPKAPETPALTPLQRLRASIQNIPRREFLPVDFGALESEVSAYLMADLEATGMLRTALARQAEHERRAVQRRMLGISDEVANATVRLPILSRAEAAQLSERFSATVERLRESFADTGSSFIAAMQGLEVWSDQVRLRAQQGIHDSVIIEVDSMPRGFIQEFYDRGARRGRIRAQQQNAEALPPRAERRKSKLQLKKHEKNYYTERLRHGTAPAQVSPLLQDLIREKL